MKYGHAKLANEPTEFPNKVDLCISGHVPLPPIPIKFIDIKFRFWAGIFVYIGKLYLPN